jgi:hypothetical protein
LPDDRVTISISADADRIVSELVEAEWFANEVAAFQAAVALALANDLKVDPATNTNVVTKWNVGSLNPRIAYLVRHFAPEYGERPMEAATLLAEVGLRALDSAHKSGQQLSEALAILDETPSSHDSLDDEAEHSAEAE